MMNKQVCAGIVLFNPNLDRLAQNVEAISLQVGLVLCFDNGSRNVEDVMKLLSRFSNVRVIEGGNNLGIPVALNRMAKVAKESGFSWFVSLDQDSVCPGDMVEKLMSFQNFEHIGVICPRFVDSRRPQEESPKGVWCDVEDCITSGMLMRLDVFDCIGGMDEELFIGFVDDEYCYRLKLSGYRIVQVNTVVLDHELGDITPSRLAGLWLMLGGLLHSKKVKALSYKRKVNPMRVYYGTRNAIYLEKKYRHYGNPMFTRKAAIENGVSNILRAQDKKAVVAAFRKGLRDGDSCEVAPWKAVNPA